MHDLFEREVAILEHAKSFSDSMSETHGEYYYEFITMIQEYELLLRQARLLLRCSDLTTGGLNADKLSLLDRVNIDGLTGIYNRQYLENNLRRYHKILSRIHGRVSLLMIDIDFFKKYNDTYGHTAGDICLKKVASVLQLSVNRTEDFVARYGGEEFTVVLSGVDKAGAVCVAQRTLENIRNLAIPHEKNEVAPYVTVSVGVMSAFAQFDVDPLKYIECADAALYQSKRTGRNKMTYLDFEGDTV